MGWFSKHDAPGGWSGDINSARDRGRYLAKIEREDKRAAAKDKYNAKLAKAERRGAVKSRGGWGW